MKSNKNISNISESDEDTEGMLLALKSALNPEDLISDELWFSWSKRLAGFPFSSELVCKIASKNHFGGPFFEGDGSIEINAVFAKEIAA